jgi:hypothetical protein
MHTQIQKFFVLVNSSAVVLYNASDIGQDKSQAMRLTDSMQGRPFRDLQKLPLKVKS